MEDREGDDTGNVIDTIIWMITVYYLFDSHMWRIYCLTNGVMLDRIWLLCVCVCVVYVDTHFHFLNNYNFVLLLFYLCQSSYFCLFVSVCSLISLSVCLYREATGVLQRQTDENDWHRKTTIFLSLTRKLRESRTGSINKYIQLSYLISIYTILCVWNK